MQAEVRYLHFYTVPNLLTSLPAYITVQFTVFSIQKPYPLLPLVTDYQIPADGGDEFHWFVDENKMIVALVSLSLAQISH